VCGSQVPAVGSVLEDGLDLEADRDLVTDHDAAVHRDGDVDTEVAAVDLRGRGEASPLPAERVRTGRVQRMQTPLDP
jgi:hypothetical protein